MAQGLDLKSWNNDNGGAGGMESKPPGETGKKARGVGSRRIFPPQFKLQVLDSYRNDVDCRGNQRATARKYNIHRRQIQKWLQCEQNLRTSVEDSARNECATESSPRKKSEEAVEEEEKTDSTLSQSATGFARLGDAGRPKESRQETAAEDSKLEAQTLKRVAQKLYPSLQGLSCGRGERVAGPGEEEGPKFFGGDVPLAVPAEARDDNFNKVARTEDDGPLDLKSKVRSEMLPEEFLASNGGGGASGDCAGPDKLNMGGLSSPSENIGGQKLSVSNAVLKCLVQKYTGDVGGREFYTREPENKGLLCSQSVTRAESSSLFEGPQGKSSGSPRKRKLAEGEDEASERSKSFNPKRKWLKESMQEMLEDSEQFQDTSSLPIKQRVKMNLRSLPEATYASEDCTRPSGISSNFSIERLCSTDTTKESDCRHGWRSSSFSPPHTVPKIVSFHFGPDQLLDRLSPANVPLKEERVSDGEDIDIDILSTTPVEKKSFDFSSFNFGKRRSFSVQFKLTVLDAFYNDKECNKNQRATARKFNINRRQVQKWLSQESDLRSEGSLKNGKYLQRQRLGGESREGAGDGCTRCPQHCLRGRKETEDAYDKTIEVNVKHCSDNECLVGRRRERFPSSEEGPKGRLGDEFYSKTLFPADLKPGALYQNYLFNNESHGLVYHESLFGWPNLSSSALPVPNFQYLSSWHHSFEFCPENQKIY